MIQKKIVLKLFIITLLFFSVFLSIFIIGQTVFFKKFHLSEKTSNLKNNIENFSRRYSKENWDIKTISENVNEFTNKNNAQIAILDTEGKIKYSPTFEIVLKNNLYNSLKIPLNNVAYLGGFQNLKLGIGSEVEIEGYFNSDFSKTLSLLSITNGTKKWIKPLNTSPKIMSAKVVKSVHSTHLNNINNKRKMDVAASTVGYTLKKIKGKIIDANIPSQIEQTSNYNNQLLWSAIDYWNWLLKTNTLKMHHHKINTFYYSSISSGVDNIVLVKSVLKNNKPTESIFVISSLQPVGEAIDTMKVYYIYTLVAGFSLIIVMTFIFSKFVTKPLIKINETASKMADLDFSQECNIKSNDELGNLGLNLNRLSKNLSTSLNELKIANEQLQLDIEKERTLEKMRKEFISSVSHELKTPLGIIKGFSEGLKDNIAENKKDYYIDVILDEVEKMDELVLDLLDLAKLESNAYKLNLQDFCIFDLLDEVQSRLLNRVNEKNINLELEYDYKTLKVNGDKKRIEQVITNILSNAIRHTNDNGYIKISTVKIADELCIGIENSGEQISQNDLNKIWDRFYRVEKSRDRKTGGTGLGLAIVKNILILHNSRFGVENTLNGVNFYFTLKIRE